MNIIDVVNNMSDDKVKLMLLLLLQQEKSNIVVSPEPNGLPSPTTLLEPKTNHQTIQPTPPTPTIQPNQPIQPTPPTPPITITTEVATAPNQPTPTIQPNQPIQPTPPTPPITITTEVATAPKQKLTRGKHRIGAVKPTEELSNTPIAILRRNQYAVKKNDPQFLEEKARKAREYRAKKKLEVEQQQTTE
jgi:hypothetical protein